MEKDERLLPLPNAGELNLTHQDVSAAYSPVYEEDFKEGRSIQEYFSVVYKRLPLILALTILATAATAFYMYRQPTIYEAQTVVVMQPRKPKVQGNQPIYLDLGDSRDYYNTQLRLLQNNDLMKRVVVQLNLQRDPNLFAQENKGFVSSLRAMFSSDKAPAKDSTLVNLSETSAESTTTKLTPEEEARAVNYAGILSGGLSVERLPDTNLVNVRVSGTNPELVARVSNTLADIFITEDQNREVQSATNTNNELKDSIEKLRHDIDLGQQARIAYMERANLPLQEEGEKLAAGKLQTLSNQWLVAEDNRQKIQAQYEAAVQASGRGELPAVLDDNKHFSDLQNQNITRKQNLDEQLAKLDAQIQEAEAKRSELLVRYTEEYGEVKALVAKIEQLKQQRADTETAGLKKIENEGKKDQKDVERQVLTVLAAQLTAAKNREAQAYNLYMRESDAAGVQGQSRANLTNITREIETNRQLLDNYTKLQKEQELAISRDRPDNVFVSNRATVGGVVGPNRNRNILIAFLLSLMTGIGLAFLFDYLDDSIKTSDDVGRYLGLPTLALIPHYSSIRKNKDNALTTAGGNPASKALVTLEDNRSPMAEAYRHLRTSLLFSSAGKPPQTILVTSSQPSEGKTTTAINTAITLAQAGADVVIIDCDLRRPRLHSHFELDNTTGLTNYLSGDKNPENLLKSYPGLPNLKIMTSGPIPPNPAELLTSNEMKNLLQFLRGNFKHVVVDSPPAISFTDAAILATLVDGVVFVAMAGKSSIHLMRRFKQRLAGIGARIYGVVINGIKPNSVEYGYYGYGYTYSYYETPDDDTTPRMEEKKYAVHTTER